MNEQNKLDQVTTLKNKEIQIRCPECGNTLSVRLIQVAKEESVTCTVCQKKIRLKDKYGNVRKSFEAIEKLGSAVKSININIKS